MTIPSFFNTPKVLEARDAYLAKIQAQEQGIVKLSADLVEDQAILDKLIVWQRTSTTAKAIKISPTGAADLPQAVTADGALPRVSGWKTILSSLIKTSLKRSQREFARRFLMDILFWHHQSTTGRWNVALGRFERWGVRSVDQWRQPPELSSASDTSLPSRRTFHRIKRQLEEMGLIEAEAHLWAGKNHLWIKPTEELSRIIFELGYWQTVRETFVVPATPAKPRGNSKMVVTVKEEQQSLYGQAIKYELAHLSHDDMWKVFHYLTNPVPLSANYMIKPFAKKGSHRWKALHSALFG